MKHIELTRQHLVNGLVAAGINKANILLQTPLGETMSGTTGASISTVLAPLEYVNKATRGSITHGRKVLWQATVQFNLEIFCHQGLKATEELLSNFLIWLSSHKLNDPETGEPITFQDPMQISWVEADGTLLKANRVGLILTTTASIYNDTELIDITVILQRRIAGGNPNE
ncbi:hypothetical protein [Deinococcus cellulosilyticus]|uniref:Uncharacterized protein n=1 Tax=Deinococcus cellulosilyticus (strain DSM 18568 / NBRC 106333 / KACC 11606 / 5516J-15) TaxID=1223518 RepID=A0A511MXE6_DEIC1|nr:hypothetical protein [Deinococcus cellulosilyticus]GEM44827.1 hypothetical protein DC3_04620 [Deinococcus cellulosilyticus NBRC 106333 = KACC 11606]